MKLLKTGERVIPSEYKSTEDYLIYLRHVFAYNFASGKVKTTDYGIDIGCGEGYGTDILSDKVSKIVGLDVDEDTIQHAKKIHENANIDFQKYGGKIIPFEDNTFDFAVSFQVIEHIPHDELYISEVYRVLKNGGIFILTTPNKTNRLKPGQKPWNKYHIREYYPNELKDILLKHFDSVEILGVFGKKDIHEIELNRIIKNQKLATMDPLNLRRFIPEMLKIQILNFVRKDNKKLGSITNRKFNIDDIYTKGEEVNQSLDLLGICTK